MSRGNCTPGIPDLDKTVSAEQFFSSRLLRSWELETVKV